MEDDVGRVEVFEAGRGVVYFGEVLGEAGDSTRGYGTRSMNALMTRVMRPHAYSRLLLLPRRANGSGMKDV